MKDCRLDASGRASPSMLVDRGHRRGGGGRAAPRPTFRATVARRFPTPWRRPRQTSRRWMRHRRRRTRPNGRFADKGYHSRAVLSALFPTVPGRQTRSRRPRPAFRAGTVMRRRGARSPGKPCAESGVAREAFKLRPRWRVERCFADNLDRGGMRRTWLRGRENVHKRYLGLTSPATIYRY